MRPVFGCDYSIACCVSAMCTGVDMQFFGAQNEHDKGSSHVPQWWPRRGHGELVCPQLAKACKRAGFDGRDMDRPINFKALEKILRYKRNFVEISHAELKVIATPHKEVLD